MATRRGLVPFILRLGVAELVLCCSIKTSSPCTHTVEEGNPLKLHCPETMEHADRDLVWNIQNASGHWTQVSRCPAGQSQCEDQQPNHFTANRNIIRTNPSSNDTSDNTTSLAPSTLLLSNLTGSHHGMTVACGTQNTGSDLSVLKACKIETYRKPRDPICDARKTGENTITVTCSASDVFPNLVCDITEIEPTMSSIRRVQDVHDIVYSSGTSTLQKDGAEIQTCGAEVHVPVKGMYAYTAVMWPQVTQVNIRQMSVAPELTKPILIEKSLATVYLRQGDFVHDICSEGITRELQFHCEAFGFRNVPNFAWLVSDGRVSKSQVKEATIFNGNGRVYSHLTTVSMKISEKNDAQEIKCTVQDAKTTGDRFLEDKACLRIRAPPKKRPIFRSSDQSIIESVSVNSYDTNFSSSCYISSGRPSVSLTVVNCFRMNMDNDLGGQQNQTYSNHSNLISFTLKGTAGERWACHCSGQHVTGCYKYTSMLEITFAPKEQPTRFILAIGLPCISLVCICIVILISCIVHKRHEVLAQFGTLISPSPVANQDLESPLIDNIVEGKAENSNRCKTTPM